MSSSILVLTVHCRSPPLSTRWHQGCLLPGFDEGGNWGSIIWGRHMVKNRDLPMAPSADDHTGTGGDAALLGIIIAGEDEYRAANLAK